MGILGDVGNFLTGQANAAYNTIADAAELTALTGAGIPLPISQFIQQERRSLGFGPITNPGWLAVFVMVMVIIIGILAQLVYSILYTLVMIIIGGFTGSLSTKGDILIFCLTMGFLISFFIYLIIIQPILKSQNINPQTNITNTIAIAESFANPGDPAPIPDTALINLQSFAVKQAAYMGPTEKGGSFDTSIGIQSALSSGVRVFVFEIDYLESAKDSTKFDAPYTPTLLYRDDSGTLISANGAKIEEVAKSLATYGFAPSLAAAKYPLIVYLHFVKTPNALREPEKYVTFLSTVAQYLEPLQPYTLGITPQGKFQRQQNETGLLQSPISSFEGKVLFMTNVDTSIFRNLKTLGMDTIDPKYDLDYQVCLRMYLDNPGDSLGSTTAATAPKIPVGVVVPFQSLATMSEADQDAFAAKGKLRFVIAMPGQIGNPSVADLSTVVSNCNVNLVPLNLFGEPTDTLKKKMAVWGPMPFFLVKAPSYRSTFVSN
jgi:hypothetical protein